MEKDLKKFNTKQDKIYEQLKVKIMTDELKPGSVMPSIRNYAKEMETTPRIIAAAYDKLKEDSLIFSVERTKARVCKISDKQKEEFAIQILTESIEIALKSGYTKEKLYELISEIENRISQAI